MILVFDALYATLFIDVLLNQMEMKSDMYLGNAINKNIHHRFWDWLRKVVDKNSK